MLEDLAKIAEERSSQKRVELLRRITDLYIDKLGRHTKAEAYLFDDILSKIVDRLPRHAKIHSSVHLAALPDAPHATVRKLAADPDIEVARPVLGGSPALEDRDILEFAQAMSQEHLKVIATRSTLCEQVTDVLIRRGNRVVMLTLSANHGARMSEHGMSGLIDKAEGDDELQAQLVDRPDLSRAAIEKLMPLISRKLAEKLAERGHDLREAVSPQLLGEVGNQFEAALRERERNVRHVSQLMQDVRSGRLTVEQAVVSLASAGRLLDLAAVVGEATKLGRNQAFALMSGGQLQPILVLLRAVGLPWPVAEQVLALRAKKLRLPAPGPHLRRDYEAVDPVLAQRVIRFLNVRQSVQPADEKVRAAS